MAGCLTSTTSRSWCNRKAMAERMTAAVTRNLVLSAAVLAAFVPQAAAQNPQHAGQYAPADIQHGAAIYAAQCTGCHGPNGDGVAGINLPARRFKRVNTH